jgi:hypothetical protein
MTSPWHHLASRKATSEPNVVLRISLLISVVSTDQAASNCCGHLLAALYTPLYSDVVGVSRDFDRDRMRCGPLMRPHSRSREITGRSRAISNASADPTGAFIVRRRCRHVQGLSCGDEMATNRATGRADRRPPFRPPPPDSAQDARSLPYPLISTVQADSRLCEHLPVAFYTLVYSVLGVVV